MHGDQSTLQSRLLLLMLCAARAGCAAASPLLAQVEVAAAAASSPAAMVAVLVARPQLVCCRRGPTTAGLRQRALLAAALASLVGAATACRTDLECELNGACVSGACACRPQWTGPTCGILNLLPAPVKNGFKEAASSAWGFTGGWRGYDGDDDGQPLLHAVVSRMEGHCGIGKYGDTMGLTHVVTSADTPLGPWRRAPSAVAAWGDVNDIAQTYTGNPGATRDPISGLYLIYHQGCGPSHPKYPAGKRGWNCSWATGTRLTPPPPPAPPGATYCAAGKCDGGGKVCCRACV
jgi:hypothetical protein